MKSLIIGTPDRVVVRCWPHPPPACADVNATPAAIARDRTRNSGHGDGSNEGASRKMWPVDNKFRKSTTTMSQHARRLWAALVGAILSLPAVGQAALDPTDVIQIHATASFVRDNNLYRLPDLDPRLFGIDPAKTSDTTFLKGVGLKFNKLISRQRLIADVNLNESTYDKNTNLDFFGGDGRATWQWQVGNYWSGEATYRKRRSLGGFADTRQFEQNLIDTEEYTITGGYEFHPRWRISAEMTENEQTHSANSRRTLNNNAHTLGAEVRYRTPALNSIGVQARRTDRTFPNRTTVGFATVDNAHTETRLNAVASWQYTGALKLDAQLGHVEVKHDQLSQRDFSGATWRAGATLDATAKLRLSLNTARDVRLYEDLATSFIVVNSIGFVPIYAATPKLVFQGDFSFEKRDYRGDPGFVLVNINRADNVRLSRIGLTYSPIRNIDLSLSYEAGDRKSSNFLNSFDYQVWFGTIRIGF